MSSFKRRASVAVACAIPVVVLAWPTSFAGAHGIGGRSDLPLPVWQVAWGAGVAVVLSFAILGLAWTKPRLVRLAVGRPLPRLPKPLAVFVGATTRVVGVAVLALTIAAGIAGDDSGAANFAPVALYVVLWVGVAFLCGLVGDLWPAFNPLATMATLLERRRAPRNTSARVPTAALGLLAFAWLELCYHDSVSPRVVGWAVAAYVLVVAGAVAMFGKAWLDGGEAFTTYFGLLGGIGPVGHDSEGRLRLRMPLSGLSTLEASPAVLWLVIVALGSMASAGCGGGMNFSATGRAGHAPWSRRSVCCGSLPRWPPFMWAPVEFRHG